MAEINIEITSEQASSFQKQAARILKEIVRNKLQTLSISFQEVLFEVAADGMEKIHFYADTEYGLKQLGTIFVEKTGGDQAHYYIKGSIVDTWEYAWKNVTGDEIIISLTSAEWQAGKI